MKGYALVVIALLTGAPLITACGSEGPTPAAPQGRPVAESGGRSAAVTPQEAFDTPEPVASAEGVERADGAGGLPTGGQAGPAGDRALPGPLFTDVTKDSGTDFLHQAFKAEIIDLGVGVVVLDFDGDGFDDLYVSNARGPNALFRNDGDGTFVDVAVAEGVDDPFGRGNGGCAADYDNDGDTDLYATNYGTSKLYRNGGAGAFTEVTPSAGVQDPDRTHRSTGCAWGDYDGDRFLDLVVVRHVHEPNLRLFQTGGFTRAIRVLSLYHNDGDGSFSDVTGLLGSTSAPDTEADYGNVWGVGFQPGWADFDNDGDLDVVNDFGPEVQPNVLWQNRGPGGDGSWSFDDISLSSRAGVPMYGMGLAVGDYDLDGLLDLYVTNIGHNVLLRNDGDGLSFSNVTQLAGVGVGTIGRTLRVSWGTLFFDYDNDEDIYVASGYLRQDPRAQNPAPFEKEQPNVLLRNESDGTFADVSLFSGADDPGVGRGAAFFDFNNDGCLDLFVSNVGQSSRLFQNLCDSGNNWLVVETVGTAGNSDGIGARITVHAGASTQIREIAAGSSQMSQNMMAAHFGLGEATMAEVVTVRWPGGEVQTLTDVLANQRLTVTEPR